MTRRRAAFERVLAGISLRFINVREADLDSIVAQALADMARCVGADRAYVLAMDSSEQTYTWCRQGVLFPPGWPERVPLLLRYRFPSFDGVVHVPRTARLPPGEARDAVTAVGLDGWACVAGRGPNGSSVLLGFDAVTHASRIMPAGELGLLRTALDTIVNVLGRRSLEQERTRIEARLEQTRRLETVGALASGIAHNFNNIVGAILGYVELADEQDGLSPILHEIRRAGERARTGRSDTHLCAASRRAPRPGGCAEIDGRGSIAAACGFAGRCGTGGSGSSGIDPGVWSAGAIAAGDPELMQRCRAGNGSHGPCRT
jgi:hypothetical protein